MPPPTPELIKLMTQILIKQIFFLLPFFSALVVTPRGKSIGGKGKNTRAAYRSKRAVAAKRVYCRGREGRGEKNELTRRWWESFV